MALLHRVRVFYGVGQRQDFEAGSLKEAQSLSSDIIQNGMRIEASAGSVEEFVPVAQIVRVTIEPILLLP